MKFFIDPAYTHREKPEYAVDDFHGIVFQPRVYGFAHALMSHCSLDTLIDVGCGSGDKLQPFIESGFNVIPIDHGSNIELFRQRHGFTPASFDLESDLDLAMAVQKDMAHVDGTKSLLVCSDVVEHLVHPDRLMSQLRKTTATYGVPFLIISTPDREKLNNVCGPPTNKAHVREWKMDEFRSFCLEYFRVLSTSYTTTVVNLDGTQLCATIQVLATPW